MTTETLPAAIDARAFIQPIEAPKWESIGAALISAFCQSVPRADLTRRSYAQSAKHFFAYLADIHATHCTSLEVAGYYSALKAKIDAGELKAATAQAYIQAAGRVIEWGRTHAQEADDLGMSGAIGMFKQLFPGRPFENRPKTETFKGHKRAALAVSETDSFLNYFEARIIDEMGTERASRLARRNRCMMYLMNELGLREIELCRLRLRDVQIEGHNLRVGITHKGKTTPCPKYIDRSFAAAAYLANWKQERREIDGASESDFMFVSLSNRNIPGEKGRQMTTRTVQNVCVPALKAIGVKCDMITTHSIRHSFATQSLEAVPVSERMQAAREIQDTMGHSTLDITLTNYAHDIDSKESRIRHIRESQRLERVKAAAAPVQPPKKRGRPKGSGKKTAADALGTAAALADARGVETTGKAK